MKILFLIPLILLSACSPDVDKHLEERLFISDRQLSSCKQSLSELQQERAKDYVRQPVPPTFIIPRPRCIKGEIYHHRSGDIWVKNQFEEKCIVLKK